MPWGLVRARGLSGRDDGRRRCVDRSFPRAGTGGKRTRAPSISTPKYLCLREGGRPKTHFPSNPRPHKPHADTFPSKRRRSLGVRTSSRTTKKSLTSRTKEGQAGDPSCPTSSETNSPQVDREFSSPSLKSVEGTSSSIPVIECTNLPKG